MLSLSRIKDKTKNIYHKRTLASKLNPLKENGKIDENKLDNSQVTLSD